jgi:hypothetical protein
MPTQLQPATASSKPASETQFSSAADSAVSSPNPVTFRAFGIGLVASCLLNLVMLYSDWYLNNTLLADNHFPLAALGVLVFLVLGCNTAARAWFKAEGLSSGELLLIWGMMGVSGGIGASGFMRYLPAWLVAPAYDATNSNHFNDQLLNYLPNWMVVSKDAHDPAVKWFFEGLPAGASIPWKAWIRPLAAWFAFGLCLYFALFSLTSIFFQQWVSRERLIFALVHLPVELAEEPAKGRLLNRLLSNPLTWIGVAIPFCHDMTAALHQYFPAVPSIPWSWSGKWFTDRPWDALDLGALTLYYSVVGLTFLLTTEMSFSIWFFFVLYKLSSVLISWMGTPSTGFFGDWDHNVNVFEASGVVLALAVFLFWTARRFLGEWLGRAWKGTRDLESDPFHPRLALLLLVAGFAGMVLWLSAAGAAWWVSLLSVIFILAIILVLARVVAEAGLLYVGSEVAPWNVLTGLFPGSWFSGASLTALTLQHGVLWGDLRCVLMPYLMNGLKACRQARVHAGKVLGIFFFTALVALVVSAYGRISTNYKYGGANLDKLGNVWGPSWTLPNGINFTQNPPAYEFLKLGNKDVLPQKVAHVLVGAGTTAVMLFLRARFLWWPLHPLGLVICTQLAMLWIWFSIFLGWLAKTCIMSFGGASLYRKLLPLFLGMALGEFLFALVWNGAAFAIGKSTYNILVHW